MVSGNGHHVWLLDPAGLSALSSSLLVCLEVGTAHRFNLRVETAGGGRL